jgi:[ribosomal protein S18]-alanine N-acetyltransferase
MNQALHLRPLTADDLPAMTALDGVCFDAATAYPPDIMADFLLQPGARALGFFAESGLAAFILWARCEIITLDVDPLFQRRGLARDLMGHALRSIRARGYRHALLQVDRDNAPALALYRALGFEILRAYREGGKRRYEMELLFPP